MKTVFLRSRYLIFLSALGIAFLYSFYRVGPGPGAGYEAVGEQSSLRDDAIRENLRRYLTTRYGHRIDEDGIVLAPRFGIPDGYGYSVVGWFCGTDGGGEKLDLYAVNAFMSASGIPLSVDRPINVSRTPDADERILDSIKDRVLFTSQTPSSNLVIVMLGFDEDGILKGEPSGTSMAHAIDAYQRFGRLTLPWRVELVTKSESPEVAAAFVDGNVQGSLDGVPFAYNVRTGLPEPASILSIVQGGTGEKSAWYTWRDVLYASAILGEGRLTTLLDMVDALSNRFDFFLGMEEHVPLFPPQIPRSLGAGELNWPPRLPFGISSDIFWANADLCQSADCPITMLEAAVEKRLQGVNVMAIDSRRLGLQYVAGRKYPISSTGLVGSSSAPSNVSTKVLLRIPITNRVQQGRTGSIAMGRTFVPPQNGQPTLLMNNRGQTAFGLWAGANFREKWSSLWQRTQPLIEGGFIVHSATESEGGDAIRHQDSAVFRSAIGLSTDGHILYAYGEDLTISKLANALIQAGAVFAIPILDHEPQAAYLRAGRVWDDGLVEQLDTPLETPSAALEYFLVYQTERLPRQTEARLDHWGPNAGRFRSYYESGGYKLMSTLSITGKELGTPEGVEVYAMDSLQLRAHLLPGWAEPRPGESERLDSLRLPSEPLLLLNIGLRNKRSPFGMIFERRVWRQPKRGALSLVADGRGTMRFGVYGSREVPDTVRWFTLIQGPPLLLDGQALGQGLASTTGVPMVAVGLKHDVAYFILSDDGNRDALVKAAGYIGLTDLMVLGERGTTDTGQVRRYFSNKGKLYSADKSGTRLRPFQAARAFDTAILFTGRVAQPQARSFSGQAAP